MWNGQCDTLPIWYLNLYGDPLFIQVSLLYANISPDDILLKRELDRLSVSYPNFKVASMRLVLLVERPKIGVPESIINKLNFFLSFLVFLFNNRYFILWTSHLVTGLEVLGIYQRTWLRKACLVLQKTVLYLWVVINVLHSVCTNILKNSETLLLEAVKWMPRIFSSSSAFPIS